VHQADRGGFDPAPLRARQGRNGGLVEGRPLPPLRVDASADGEGAVARDDQVGFLQVDGILVVAAFVADLEDVAEAPGRDRGDPRAAPLDQRVGGQRGAVDETRDVGPAAPAVSSAMRAPASAPSDGSAGVVAVLAVAMTVRRRPSGRCR
jgi:hypothetical protein